MKKLFTFFCLANFFMHSQCKATRNNGIYVNFDESSRLEAQACVDLMAFDFPGTNYLPLCKKESQEKYPEQYKRLLKFAQNNTKILISLLKTDNKIKEEKLLWNTNILFLLKQVGVSLENSNI